MILATLPSLDHVSSGPSYSVPKLCHAVQKKGEDISLFTATAGGKPNLCNIRHHSFPLGLFGENQLQFSSAMNAEIQKRSAEIDALYCNGMWAMTASAPALIAQQNKIPTLLAPRGSLSTAALAQSSFKKWIAWPFMHKRAFKNACCFHATSKKEYEEIRAFGLMAPVAIIPNGVSVPPLVPKHKKIVKLRTALFLGRLHPLKGVDLLIDAWAKLDKECSKNWQLKIIGPDVSGIKGVLGKRAAELGIPNICFEDELSGKEKRAAFQEAELFVLPSQTENFGMTIAEALSYSTPVITTKRTPWSGLKEKHCGWWIERNVIALHSALEAATQLSSRELLAMGKRGRMWMRDEYSWEKIAGEFIDVISWLKSKKTTSPPECILQVEG